VLGLELRDPGEEDCFAKAVGRLGVASLPAEPPRKGPDGDRFRLIARLLPLNWNWVSSGEDNYELSYLCILSHVGSEPHLVTPSSHLCDPADCDSDYDSFSMTFTSSPGAERALGRSRSSCCR
jgi:hypothetical protein